MAAEVKVGDRLQSVTHEVTNDKMVEFEKVVWDRGRNSHSDINVAKADGISRTIASGRTSRSFTVKPAMTPEATSLLSRACTVPRATPRMLAKTGTDARALTLSSAISRWSRSSIVTSSRFQQQRCRFVQNAAHIASLRRSRQRLARL